MRFPRNAKIFRGQIDFAPLAGVLFLLVIFVVLGQLIYAPGVPIELPEADNLPGTDHRKIVVAVNRGGQFFWENQLIPLNELQAKLESAVKKTSEPLTLIVLADKSVEWEVLVQLEEVARAAGIRELFGGTRPRLFQERTAPKKNP